MNDQANGFHLGIEWVGEQLRAGIFDHGWRLVGKASRSAKTSRGLDEVLRRMARCALDAVDEADLQPDHIAASAVLTEADGAGQTWQPDQVNLLASHLPAHLGAKLLAAGRVATITWAVHEHELNSTPKHWLGLFSEPRQQMVAAERSKPGQVRLLAPGPTALAADSGGPEIPPDSRATILDAIQLAQPEVLVLVGEAYEDEKSSGARQIAELLAGAGLKMPLHISTRGAHVGTWAAARLAARTFPR
jgi:hypothetical protein